MTLIEVMFAVAVLLLALGGLLATFMQSRRLTEGSVYQNAAVTIVQGYIEQMKNMDIGQMVGGYDSSGNPQLNTGSFVIPVYYSDATVDSIKTSTGTPPTIAMINSGVTPTGAQDNLKGFDMAKNLAATNMNSTDTLSYSSTAQGAWTSVWPGALDYTTANPATTTGLTDLHLNVWVWITDVSAPAQRSTKIYAITVIYTWAYTDGGRVRYATDLVRTLRSAVMTN